MFKIIFLDCCIGRPQLEVVENVLPNAIDVVVVRETGTDGQKLVYESHWRERGGGGEGEREGGGGEGERGGGSERERAEERERGRE